MIDPAAILQVISDLELRNARLEALARDQAEQIEALKAGQQQPASPEK